MSDETVCVSRYDESNSEDRAVMIRVKELFRSAGGLATINNLALALSGAPPGKVEHDIAKLSRNLGAKMAEHSDWPSPEFVPLFIAVSGELIRARLSEISSHRGGRA